MTCFTLSLAESKIGCSKMGSIFVLTFFSLYLKINIDKASQKVTKDPKHVEAARKCRENYMSKLKESILNDAKKIAEILAIQAMKLPAPPILRIPPPRLLPITLPTLPLVILISRTLVYLLSLP